MISRKGEDGVDAGRCLLSGDPDIEQCGIPIGHLVRTWRGEELVYQDGMWFFPLTQEETQEYWPAAVKAQVRVHWANGVVEGKPIYGVRIEESISKEVL